MRAGDSQRTGRTFERPDAAGGAGPYYEYRDTATSRFDPFKPEWIMPLRIVADSAPDNPDVAYNQGHLLHQQTFIIGKVNFYWEVGGRKRSAELKTGDSNYITPFVPHSFASRDRAAPGLIVAVTFSGAAKRNSSEFSRIGSAVDNLVGDMRDARAALAAKVHRFRSAESISVEELGSRMVKLGVAEDRAMALSEGRLLPSMEEIEVLSVALCVRPMDLAVTELQPEEEVVVRSGAEVPARLWFAGNFSCCRLKELVRTRHQPELRGFDVEVFACAGGVESGFCHGLYEYLYNYGDQPIELKWADGSNAILYPGDSASVRPMVPHIFGLERSGRTSGQVLVVRVGGSLDASALDDYSRFDPIGRQRLVRETTRWY